MEAVNGAAIVVGGASGIGAACAEALAADGWDVVVADLKPDGAGPHAVALDVRDREVVQSVVGDVARDHGGIGAVVYAAGTARVTPLLEIDAREWELVTSVNLTGAFNVLQASVPHLADSGGGSFTLISSVDSQSPVGGLAHYCAAKAAGESLMRSRRSRVRRARRSLQRRASRRRAHAADGSGARQPRRHRRIPRAHAARTHRRAARTSPRSSPSWLPPRPAGSPASRFPSTAG